MNSSRNLLLLALSVLFITANSCKKKAEVDLETRSAVDHSIGEDAFSNIYPTTQAISVEEEGVKSTVHEKEEGSNKKEGMSGNVTCATVTILTDTTGSDDFPFTFEIDYGSGCVDPHDGKIRQGKLKATFSDYWDKVGSTLTIELIDYYENNLKLEGVVIVNKGQTSYSTIVKEGKCIADDWDIQYNCDYTYNWLSGWDTDSTNVDDVIEMTGEAKGVNREGKAYTANILNPLIKDMSCKWIQEGVIELTPEDLSTRTIDFGDGNCDNDASVTINGNTIEFSMR